MLDTATDNTNPKPFVLVLMPFRDEFQDIYEAGIKQACKDAGAYSERVDEQIFVESILERIYNQISKADIIVADMTGQNPNVFYEVGYAHALNKQVILLTQDTNDIPFDLKHYPHIVYSGRITSLKSQLEPRIRWCIANPKQPLSTREFTLNLYIDGQQLQQNNLTELTRSLQVRQWIDMKRNGDTSSLRIQELKIELTIHNPSNQPYSTGTSIATIIPRTYPGFSDIYLNTDDHLNVITLPDTSRLVLIHDIPKLLPNAWDKTRFTLLIIPGDEGKHHNLDELMSILAREHLDIPIRAFTELGTVDHPVRIKVDPHLTTTKINSAPTALKRRTQT